MDQNEIIITNIKIDGDLKKIMNWPDSFYLFRIETILSMYYQVYKINFKKVYDKDELYIILTLSVNKKTKNEIDIYELINKYIDYSMIFDINKFSKGPSHKNYCFNLINYYHKNNLFNKNKDDILFIDNNFILEKVKDQTEYYERFDYYKDLIKLNIDSKKLIVYNQFPFKGKFKKLNDNVFINENNSLYKVYNVKNNMIMYIYDNKIRGTGMLYNIIYYLQKNNITMDNFHCFFIFDNNMEIYIEVVSNDANILDNLVNVFLSINELIYIDFDIIEYDGNFSFINNTIIVYNMYDHKKYMLLSKK